MRTIKMKMLLLLFAYSVTANAQTVDPALYWQGKERTLRYQPQGDEFVIHNGDKRFNRPIYGTNTGFRFDTSDFPEFGLYMPYIGGSVYMAIATPVGTTHWIKEMESIEARFKSGQRTYIVKDKKRLGNGSLTIDVVALSDGDGLVVKYQANQLPANTKIVWVYGGANNERLTRDGDLGADPADSFFIKAVNCKGNLFQIENNKFTLLYGMDTKLLTSEEAYGDPKTWEKSKKATANAMQITGVFPTGTVIREADGKYIEQIERLVRTSKSDFPVIMAEYTMGSAPFYMELHNPKSHAAFAYSDLAEAFGKGIDFRTNIASRMKINTPDPFLNTLGGVFSGAEDAAWEAPIYLHGAICFRDYILLGWRGAYLADLLGLQDRARMHFTAYANSQVTNVPVTLPHKQDNSAHLARSAKEWGTPMYSNGYICRVPDRRDVMAHYNMNLVYIDQLLWHLNWTGDMEYVKQVFPVIQQHLAWDKNTFDPDNDGLYDACCVIWASDALQYNGGKVTHSSAYSYRANKMMAEIARKIGEDPSKYDKEAALILSAINKELWIKDKGRWAEFKDNMGKQMRHEEPGLWTFYHAIDSDIHDPFQAYQASRYIDTELARIPVVGEGLKELDNYVIPTTNWQPYMWSINNVAFAEVMHTALAYWQTGRSEEAFKMFKGMVLDAMYLGTCPGNVAQVTFYDAARGECYRDFTDATACGVRAVVHGMYGIIPDLMNNRLTIKPGFPDSWNFAELETQNIAYAFHRNGQVENYVITPNLLRKGVSLSMEIKAPTNQVKSVTVNGKSISYTWVPGALLQPRIRFEAGVASQYDIRVEWEGNQISKEAISVSAPNGSQLTLKLPNTAGKLYDPQEVLTQGILANGVLSGQVSAALGHRTVFVNIAENGMDYWQPIDIHVTRPLEITNHPEASVLTFDLKNNTNKPLKGDLFVNGKKYADKIDIAINGKGSYTFEAPVASLGTNTIEVRTGKDTYNFQAINWNIPTPVKAKYETVNMEKAFNEKVRDIFGYGKYLSPRWKYTTLCMPTQGMGEWCHPNDLTPIDDTGIREIAAQNNNRFMMPQGIPFATPGGKDANNIAFTTLWDNYPTSLNVPLKGKASKVYLLVAGTTYFMQSHLLNGTIRIQYKDGHTETLELILPENLLPINQDVFIDGWAFDSKEPRPWRVRLKTGDVSKFHAGDLGVRMSNNPLYVEGGMATMLDIPLNPAKELASLSLETVANEIIIGLMGITLTR